MRKLLQGIVDFRARKRDGVLDTFARLALGQSPDVLMIACADSRVVPNLFASTDPGDLFVVRNVGNLVPADSPSENAAVEFAVRNLKVNHIIVCGHSNCGAMHALLDPPKGGVPPRLSSWLDHARGTLERLGAGEATDARLNRFDRLSQLNVLEQLRNLAGNPAVAEAIRMRRLRLHGWWFEIGTADVYSYDEAGERFVLIDAAYAGRLLGELDA
jgi:carbonic anhydrase